MKCNNNFFLYSDHGTDFYIFNDIIYVINSRKIYLIGVGYYDNRYFEMPDVSINNEIQKNIKLYANKSSNERSRIFEISINDDITLSEKMDIIINGKNFEINNINIIENDIATCTLFKYDYQNMQTYINYYYVYHGIKSFYLYYNGDIEEIKDYIYNIIIENDCNVYVFEMNYQYLQKWQDNKASLQHYSQMLQLSHSAILSNYFNDYLMNLDFDEFIDLNFNIREELQKHNILYFGEKYIKCMGDICKNMTGNEDLHTIICNYYENIIPKKSHNKYIEKTKGRHIFIRFIHYSCNSKNSDPPKEVMYHLKCLSYGLGKKRRCCV